MKIIILLSCLVSLSFSQYFGGNIQIGGAFPKGELMNQEVPNALAFDFNLNHFKYEGFHLNAQSKDAWLFNHKKNPHV